MLKEELRRKSLRDKIDDLSEDQAHFVLLSVFYSGDKSRYISEDPNRYASKCKEGLLKRTRKDDKIDTVISFIDNLNTLYLEKYELKWLEGNERAQIFVYNYLVENNMISPSRFGISRKKDIKDTVHNILNNLIKGLNNRENVISDLDFKKDVVEVAQKVWHVLEANDNYSKWLKKADLDWVRNYLVEKNLYRYDVENYVGNNNRELRLLASLDAIDIKQGQSYTHSPSKTIIIDKMKRAWSQQKYRDAGKTKKPYHLPLTKKTKARLEKMAEVEGLSETAMLDHLINMSYEIDYTDKNGKDLY